MSAALAKLQRLFAAAVVATTIASCTSTRYLAYESLVEPIDEHNLLEISTYPTDYGNRINDKDAVFAKRETHNELYFQIYVRDKKWTMGEQPHIQSIAINRFAYRLNDGPSITLLSDYDHYFWMQGNPRYETRALPPVPYIEDGVVQVEIDFTLNAADYLISGEMPAVETWTTLPTALAAQSP